MVSANSRHRIDALEKEAAFFSEVIADSGESLLRSRK